MADTKRWTVTYTRHLTQKRKVYQDGMLELHCSSNKVTLYSDTEEAIANRYLKKDEVVKSGSTLAFDAYLVDVADPDVKTKPLKENGPCFGSGRKIKLENDEPSRNPSLREWHALYTTQKTQKAKRYHDGFLQIEACGLRMNQVTLKNEEGDVLGSKYFRSDEGIKTGGTCEFANYLVQIGEPQTTLAGEIQKDSSSGQVRVSGSRNSNIDMSTSDAGVPRENALQNGKIKLKNSRTPFSSPVANPGTMNVQAVIHEQGKNKSKNSRTPFSSPVANPGAIKGNLKNKFDSCEASKCHPDSTQAVLKGNLKNKFDSCEASKCHPDSTQAVLKEWHALYTTQKTQKAKKFHDGFLRLGTCGSYLNQVILTNEDGEILGSKYLKSSEYVKTGGMCELPNYLVEIGEPRTTQAGDKKSAPPDALTDPSNSMQESVRENFKRNISWSVMGLHPSNSISYSMGSGKVSGSSMQRDASQILSILKKPAIRGDLGPLKHQAEQSHSDVPQLDVQHNNETMKQHAPGDLKLDKTTAQPRSVFSQTEATQEIPVRRATISIDSDNFSKMPSESPTQLFDVYIGKSDIFNHGVAKIPDSNLEQSTIVVEEFSGFSHPKGNQHLTDAPPCDPSRFGSKVVQKYNAVKDEMSRQPYKDVVEVGVGSDEVHSSSPPPCQNTLIRSPKEFDFDISYEKQEQMNDFPTFDLGI